MALAQSTKEILLGEKKVEMNTTLGTLTFKIFEKDIPKASENFLTHAENGYYNGLIFHRVINDFMIQGGDPTGTGMGGHSIWNDDFEDEFTLEHFNFYGALCMANAGPSTNGSQFFIVQAKHVDSGMLANLERGGWPKEAVELYAKNGGTPWLDQRHTVFGHLIDGYDVLEKIAKVSTDFRDKPLEDVKINSINIF